MVKRLRNSVQNIRRYSTKYASFFAVSYQTFTNELCQLWRYWTEVHEFFPRYRDIIYAVNALIVVAISHSVSECKSDEKWDIAIFSQNCLRLQSHLRYRKKRSRSIISNQNAFIQWKDCENQSSESWDNCSLREEIKTVKRKKLTQAKYSPPGKFAKQAK